MAIQQLATLWTPAIWIPGIAEKQATFPHLFNSGAVKRTDLLTELATGPGVEANVPFLKDITDQDNEVQVEHTAPVTVNGAPGDVCKFPILNRVTKNAWTAMAKNVSGADLVSHVWGTMGERRLKQQQKTLVAMLRGVLGTGADAVGNAAALAAVRYGGAAEPFSENGANPVAQNIMSPDIFIGMKALMGELAESLENGCLFIHPDVLGSLEIQDAVSFKTVTPGLQSALPFTIRTYRGVPIFLSTALRRAGTGSGYVYDSYLIAQGTIGFGEKPQVADQADAASLAYFYDRDLNDDLIWDRTRTAFGLDGTAFDSSALGGQSASDAELQTIAKWSLKYQSANRVGVVAVRTNK